MRILLNTKFELMAFNYSAKNKKSVNSLSKFLLKFVSLLTFDRNLFKTSNFEQFVLPFFKGLSIPVLQN